MDLTLERRAPLSAQVNKTLSNTFITVGAMLSLTAVMAFSTVGVRLPGTAYLGLFIASIVLIFATQALRNSGWGLAMLAIFAGVQGVALGPLMAHYLHVTNGSSLLATAAGLTAAATFACAGYAITSRRDFSRIRGFLFGALLLLVLTGLVGMFIPMPGLQLALAGVGALVFLGYLLLDVGDIVSGAETNYISASMGLFLDVLNLFLNILRLLEIFGGSDD